MSAGPPVHLSRRLPWDRPDNDYSRRLTQARVEGRKILDLTESNPTKVELMHADSEEGLAIRSALATAAGSAEALSYTPEARGLAVARSAVAAYYRRRGYRVGEDRILLTASTSEAYSHLFKLFCDPGDVVLSPRPSYPLLDHLASLDAVTLRPYPLSREGTWSLDFAALQQAMDGEPAPRALLAVHPNNPTGHYLKRGERTHLTELCRARGVPLIVDEVFGDYVLREAGGAVAEAGRAGSFVDEMEASCFVLGGLSKLIGMPQAKLAWIVAGGPPTEAARAMAGLELVADGYLSPGTAIQLAAPSLLSLQERITRRILERVAGNFARLQSALVDTAVQLIPVEGGWCATLRLPAIQDDERWCEALLAAGVLVQPGYFFDLDEPACIVVSLLLPPAVLDEGARRIAENVSTALRP